MAEMGNETGSVLQASASTYFQALTQVRRPTEKLLAHGLGLESPLALVLHIHGPLTYGYQESTYNTSSLNSLPCFSNICM